MHSKSTSLRVFPQVKLKSLFVESGQILKILQFVKLYTTKFTNIANRIPKFEPMPILSGPKEKIRKFEIDEVKPFCKVHTRL